MQEFRAFTFAFALDRTLRCDGTRDYDRTVVRDRALALLTAAILAAAAAAAAPLSAQDAPEARPDATDDIARVERVLRPAIDIAGRATGSYTIEERMRHYDVPGVSIAVVDEGRIAWARGYGVTDAATERPVTPATRFQAASISKPVAALAALRLVDDGELDLDEDVNRRLTSWRVPENELTEHAPVTLRGLLTHSAGLTVHGFGGYAVGEPVPDVVDILDGRAPANSDPVRVDLEPGAEWRYSGGGYTVMQLLLTDVTGRPFPDLVDSLVLEPLGMRESTYEQPPPDTLEGSASTAHGTDGLAIDGRYHTYPEMAAAGLWTTPSDLARYVLGVQAALDGIADAILSRDLARAMVTREIGTSGLGPAVAGRADSLRFQHGGSNRGFKAFVLGYADRGRGVAIMTNGERGSALAQEVLFAVAEVYGWPGIGPRRIEPLALDAAALDAYVGRYDLEDGPQPSSLRIARDGDRLTVELGPASSGELIPVAPDRFLLLPGGQSVEAERDADGRVVAMRGGGGRWLRARRPTR